MKKIKLFLAAIAAMVAVGVQAWDAPTKPAYSTSWATPTDGETYYIYNVDGGTFLGGGRDWGTRAVSTVEHVWADGDAVITPSANVDYALPFKLEKTGDLWFLVHQGTNKGTKYMFYDGNAAWIDNTSGHAGAKWNIVSTEKGYRLDPSTTGKYFGVHSTNLVSEKTAFTWADFADLAADKWVYWQFVPVSEANAVKEYASTAFEYYHARLSLYNQLLGASEEGVSTEDAGVVYNNTGATIAQLNEATTALKLARVENKNATESNPQDITDIVVVNADFSTLNGDGWTRTGSWGNQQWGQGTMESWNNSNVSVTQDLTGLPNGRYKVSCDMISGNAGRTAYVYAKGMTEVNGENVNAQSSAGNYTTMSNEVAGNTVSAYPVLVDNHTMTIGFKDPSGWVVVDNFKVIYYGPDLAALKEVLQANIDAVASLEGTTTTAAYNAAKTYADGINMVELTTEEAIAAASAELNTRVEAAKALQSSYASYQAAVANASFAGVAEATINTQNEAVAAATEAAAINEATAALQAAIDALAFDVTSFTIKNAGAQSKTDWEGTNFGGQSDGVTEYYNVSPAGFYQTISLPAGKYRMTVVALQRTGMTGTVYVGDNSTVIEQVSKGTVNNRQQAATWFAAGNGRNYVYFTLTDAADVTIGLKADETTGDHWTVWQSFKLDTFDESVAASYLTPGFETAKAAAQAAHDDDTYCNVTGTEKTALENAIAATPSTVAEYEAAIAALTAATSAFTAAAPSYDKYVAYRAETVSLFGEELAATVAAPTTAAEAAVAVQNLNIAQYNKVATDYKYSLTSKIGDFSTWDGTAEVGTPREAGTPNYLDWEHYSGVTHPYYEQDGTGYYNAGGWTIQYTKTTTLPAGSYVVKVAARSSLGVTSSITVVNTANDEALAPTISLPCAGNRTRGINTNGVASWSDEDTFNNGNNNNVEPTVGGTGTGWQWRFVPFTLTDETEVKMTFYAEASSQYQWMSIGDGELLSTKNVASAVAYNDGETNAIEDVDLANVTITRTIKEGFNTVVLPFDLTLGQMETAFGTGAEVYAFSENSENAKQAVINFNKVDAGTISANVPVLVKATKASDSQEFEGVEVKAAAEAKVEGKYFDFVGVYAPADVEALDYFLGRDDEGTAAIYKSAGKTNIKAFRAYIDNKTPEITGDSQEVKLFIDGVATSINAINGVEAENGAIFNLAGQRVNKAQKGIYIVNGKKVLVK